MFKLTMKSVKVEIDLYALAYVLTVLAQLLS